MILKHIRRKEETLNYLTNLISINYGGNMTRDKARLAERLALLIYFLFLKYMSVYKGCYSLREY